MVGTDDDSSRIHPVATYPKGDQLTRQHVTLLGLNKARSINSKQTFEIEKDSIQHAQVLQISE
jgi:hypothetical protein